METPREFSIGPSMCLGKIEVDDIVTGTYKIKTPKGDTYELRKENERLSLEDRNTEIGALVLSSPSSGSIWMGNTCIGEYETAAYGERVIPYKDGQKQRDKVEQITPLDYLLRTIRDS